MRGKLLDFRNFNKSLKPVLILFYLDIGFILLAFIFSLIEIRLSKSLTLASLSVAIVCLIFTVYFVMRNKNIIKQAEELLRNNISEHNNNNNRAEVFQKLMSENLFHYYFQPIINAKNGEIFAYEALMRTAPDIIGLQPLEILGLAVKNNKLYDLEKLNFRNNMQILKENSELFHNKKLFINSVSGTQLNDADFNELYTEYGSLFQNVILEIMDTSHLDDDNLKLITKRLSETKLQLALDNYGTRNCTEATLIRSNPNYIKLDGSYLRDIQDDPKKQEAITSLISFASQNNIKVIAEGIETKEELKSIISLGVDYVQGFYTAKPSPEILQKLATDTASQILKLNNREFGDHNTKKLYEATGETMIYPVSLALEMYSDILICEKEVCLQGSQGMIANLSVIIPDNQCCLLTLEQVNLRGNDKPSIVLGNNCSVVLNLVGDNNITFDGIRVPETSQIKLIGDGSLSISAEQSNRIGIGGNSHQAYGNITFATKGIVEIKTSGNTTIGIGGGINPNHSLIHFISGVTSVENSGYQTVGIGSAKGNARISIEGGELKLLTEGTKAVGIGSLSGTVDIESSARLSIRCNGKNAIGIGVLEDSDGIVMIKDGFLDIKLSAFAGACIGAMGGRLQIKILNGDIEVSGNGSDIVGLGDHSGFGNISIMNGIISIHLFSIHALPIGNINRKVIIDGGNIQCDFPGDIIPVNSYGTPLVSRIILDTDEYSQAVDTVGYSYVYHARYSDRYPYIKVYLPENISY